MKTNMIKYFKDFERNEEGASDTQIDIVQKHLDFILPNDYIDLMKEFNGGEGGVGENGWLNLFPIEYLVEKNYNYKYLIEEIPDYFLFGKDAADTGYAFNKLNGAIYSFGLMSDFKTDPIEFCGNDFLEFIQYLNKL